MDYGFVDCHCHISAPEFQQVRLKIRQFSGKHIKNSPKYGEMFSFQYWKQRTAWKIFEPLISEFISSVQKMYDMSFCASQMLK